MSAMTERQADMAGDNHGDKTQEEPQAKEDLGGTVKILAHFPTAHRPALRCGYPSSSVTSR